VINVLLPAMGKSAFFSNYYFPKLMLEVNGETVLESIINNYASLEKLNIIFALREEDCIRFHLDESAKVATEGVCNSNIIILKNQTSGALCTCLMCVEKFDKDEPLIISNADQIIDIDVGDTIGFFEKNKFDAGVITFPSIHPRWSYARIQRDRVIEMAEKRPISKHAVAGFYYYRQGKDFIEAAKKVILKGQSHEGQFYLSSSLNEMILDDKKVGYFEIDKDRYHSFYSPEKIKEYETLIMKRN